MLGLVGSGVAIWGKDWQFLGESCFGVSAWWNTYSVESVVDVMGT